MNKLELFAYSYSNFPAMEVSVDPNQVSGQGTLYSPVLYIPLEIRLRQLPSNDQSESAEYTLFRLEGHLALANNEQLAPLIIETLSEQPHRNENSRHVPLTVFLDFRRIALMEKDRSGDDMSLSLCISGLVFIQKPDKPIIEKLRSNMIGIEIPQSVWIKNVLNRWKVYELSLLEIEKPRIDNSKISEKPLEHLKAAENHYLNFNHRETLSALYTAFEALAKRHDFENPDKNFFSKILHELPADKREKYRDLFHHFCVLLHLGRHEQKVSNDNDANNNEAIGQTEVNQNDAQLALIMGQTILSYISKVM